MGKVKLTPDQSRVLMLIGRPGGITKNEMFGADWRRVDALERRGLCARTQALRHHSYVYVATPAGLAALSEKDR